jgi:hypothetical protein
MSARARFVLVVAALLLVRGTLAQAPEEPTETLARQAVEAYEHGQSVTEPTARAAAFEQAERLFNAVAARGVANADLYANAGTAALQAERLGPAVLAFRRALALDPGHTRARRNLAHARDLLPAWVPRPETDSVLDTFFFWHRSLSTGERLGAAAICFLLAALAGSLAIRWPSALTRGLTLIPALAWLGLVASLVVDARSERDREAVIVAGETVARASDSPNAPARFAEPLPGGTEVAVAEARDRWVRIRLANEREAWVSRTTVSSISK